MKKLITLILVLSAWNSFAQLTLVKETDKGFEPCLLSDGRWLMVEDVSNKTSNWEMSKDQSIIFYNPDYTVYKVLNIPQSFPFDTTGFTYNSIQMNDFNYMNGVDNEYFVTDNFFNLDNKIEVLIKYRSSKTVNNITTYREAIIILNEDGSIIEKFVNLNGSLYIFAWKYLAVNFNNSSTNVTTTKHYSIPGHLPCPTSCGQKAAGIAPITQPNQFKEIQVNGFPNPSSDKVTLAYALPEGVAFGTLRLYTQSGELVKEFKVSSQVDHLELPVSEYTPGTYYYELQAGGSTSGGKKMVVIH
jgi:hypothetical protein